MSAAQQTPTNRRHKTSGCLDGRLSQIELRPPPFPSCRREAAAAVMGAGEKGIRKTHTGWNPT